MVQLHCINFVSALCLFRKTQLTSVRFGDVMSHYYVVLSESWRTAVVKISKHVLWSSLLHITSVRNVACCDRIVPLFSEGICTGSFVLVSSGVMVLNGRLAEM